LVGTNITGTASGLTAGNVTTNANLTGDVTSLGNAATVVKINGTSLAELSTGILKNTTTTGVPTIATAGTDYVAPSGTFYIGTTSITHNRSSASQTLTGTSIDGNATNVTGTVAIANGGTGLTSTPAIGQIDIGNGTTFTRATLTAGTAITITNTAGAITIAAAVRPTTDQAIATAGQTSFPLSQTPLNTKIWMFINGIRTNNLAYSVSGVTLTYTPASNNSYALLAGDRIQFDYCY